MSNPNMQEKIKLPAVPEYIHKNFGYAEFRPNLLGGQALITHVRPASDPQKFRVRRFLQQFGI